MRLPRPVRAVRSVSCSGTVKQATHLEKGKPRTHDGLIVVRTETFTGIRLMVKAGMERGRRWSGGVFDGNNHDGDAHGPGNALASRRANRVQDSSPPTRLTFANCGFGQELLLTATALGAGQLLSSNQQTVSFSHRLGHAYLLHRAHSALANTRRLFWKPTRRRSGRFAIRTIRLPAAARRDYRLDKPGPW